MTKNDNTATAAKAAPKARKTGEPTKPVKAAKPPKTAKAGTPAVAFTEKPKGKLATLVELLSRPEGATLEAMTTATGWQVHSVRGAMSGSLKKAMGLTITSDKVDGVRIYRIVKGAPA
jgi:hypothetical protein